MKKLLKISVVGAGSTYTPELVEGLLTRKGVLSVGELALMDIDAERLQIVGGFIKKKLIAAGQHYSCTLSTSLEDTLKNSDFVIVQIRVGGLEARIKDELIPLKYGMIGQETTGIGGMVNGLRTIPVILDIAAKMEQLCPAAWLINFSNPSGMVAQALAEHSSIHSVGLCNGPLNMVKEAKAALNCSDLPADIEYIGLNHLAWLTGIRVNGVQRIEELIDCGLMGNAKNISQMDIDKDAIRMAQGMPCSYLSYYYFRGTRLQQLLSGVECRGEVCKKIQNKILNEYGKTNATQNPALLSKRGGSLYSEAAIAFIQALCGKAPTLHVLNVENQGAVPFMEKQDVVEMQCEVSENKVAPLPLNEFRNGHIMEFMTTIKAYERHTINAALSGDKLEVYRAMSIHPLIGDFDKARLCFEDLLHAHQIWLPAFTAASQTVHPKKENCV